MARFRLFQLVEIPMHVAQMPKRMRQQQSIPDLTTVGHGFLVERERLGRVPGVPLDLREPFQRGHEKLLRPAAASECSRFAEPMASVGITPSLPGKQAPPEHQQSSDPFKHFDSAPDPPRCGAMVHQALDTDYYRCILTIKYTCIRS